MSNLAHLIWKLAMGLAIRKDCRGQDLIEYALLAGFVALGVGVIMPTVATSLGTIYSRIYSVLTTASSS